MIRSAFAFSVLVTLFGRTALAEEASAEEEADKPKRGSFDAGAQVRFPSGPDPEDGTFKQFKWIAVDIKGRYFLADQFQIHMNIPTAPVHQDLGDPAMGGVETEIFGGFTVRPELALDKAFGIGVTLGFLREGAFLLSEKDYPLYLGDLKFGTAIGPWIKFKKWGLEFNTTPQVIFQATDDKLLAIQAPLSAAVSLGKTFKLALDTGIYTGDDLDPRPTEGGRLSLGASIDLKLGHTLFHAGAGFASLLTSDEMGSQALYPSITDSVYVDLNVKYVK